MHFSPVKTWLPLGGASLPPFHPGCSLGIVFSFLSDSANGKENETTCVGFLLFFYAFSPAHCRERQMRIINASSLQAL